MKKLALILNLDVLVQFKKYFDLKNGNIRSIKAKKNVFLSLVVKGTSVLLTFLLVPILIEFLGKTQYGIWITIGSVLVWTGFFDLGLGHGMRNRLSEAWAKEDFEEARNIVSTTYGLTLFIVVFLCALFIVVNYFINWSQVFNIDQSYALLIRQIMIIVYSFFALQFVFQLIYNILLADQKSGIVDLLKLFSKILSFTAILLLINYKEYSLKIVAVVFSVCPLIIMIVTSILFFNKKYKGISPSFKFFRLSYYRRIMNLGIKFFIMQIAVMIMFTTDNMIITQLFGPEEVTSYSICYKYFGVVTMLFTILVSPIWSASNEAYHRGDIEWITRIATKMKKIWLGLCVLVIVLLMLSSRLYEFWVGSDINIDFSLSLLMALYVVLFTYGNIYVNIINGVGKVKLQFYTSIIASIINIPLSILFAYTFKMGPKGVIFATIVSNFYGPIISPIQFKKIIYGTAAGVWNK